MKKHLEAEAPNSCWNKASEDELVFVLLERDIATPATIRFWCQRRICCEKNGFDDPQIQNALKDAESMDGLNIDDPRDLEMYVNTFSEA